MQNSTIVNRLKVLSKRRVCVWKSEQTIKTELWKSERMARKIYGTSSDDKYLLAFPFQVCVCVCAKNEQQRKI